MHQHIEQKPGGVTIPLDGGTPAPEDLVYLPVDAIHHAKNLSSGTIGDTGWQRICDTVGEDHVSVHGWGARTGCNPPGAVWESRYLVEATREALARETHPGRHVASQYGWNGNEQTAQMLADRDNEIDRLREALENARLASWARGREIEETWVVLGGGSAVKGPGRLPAAVRDAIDNLQERLRPLPNVTEGPTIGAIRDSLLVLSEDGDKDGFCDLLDQNLLGVYGFLDYRSNITIPLRVGEAKKLAADIRGVCWALAQESDGYIPIEPEPELSCFVCGQGNGDVTLTSRCIDESGNVAGGRQVEAAHRACLKPVDSDVLVRQLRMATRMLTRKGWIPGPEIQAELMVLLDNPSILDRAVHVFSRCIAVLLESGWVPGRDVRSDLLRLVHLPEDTEATNRILDALDPTGDERRFKEVEPIVDFVERRARDLYRQIDSLVGEVHGLLERRGESRAQRRMRLVGTDRRPLADRKGGDHPAFEFEVEPGRSVYVVAVRGAVGGGLVPIKQYEELGSAFAFLVAPGVEVEAFELVPAESLDQLAVRPEPVDPRRCPHCGVIPQSGFRYCRGLARFLMMPDVDRHAERCG